MTQYQEVVAACEYMGEDERQAFIEGPVIGAARVAYVEAHKAHAKALDSGELDKIDEAWDDYCDAQNAFVTTLYGQ